MGARSNDLDRATTRGPRQSVPRNDTRELHAPAPTDPLLVAVNQTASLTWSYGTRGASVARSPGCSSTSPYRDIVFRVHEGFDLLHPPRSGRSAPSAGRSQSVSFSMAIDTLFAGVCSPRAPDPLSCRNPRAASLRPCTHRAGSSAADAPESDDRDIDRRFRHGQWLSRYPMCRFPPSISVDCFHKWR